ncbi:hypothetical protein Bhyg_06078 [Pseudolycoriella hygida]|uniref:Uncharacterized protein n=1 Tax=Pseudolycoriella hygida TaxID=35572 RepID=A0A9Q0S231_9DIPT|nr:hypothetical protein Bhyg_06078 [Pseudolycoriella hygida]
MQTITFALIFVLVSFGNADHHEIEKIREAYEKYKSHPTRFDKPEWVEEIKDFDAFQKRWNDAREYNDKYKTTEEAWAAHKQKEGLKYDSAEDEKRYGLFKPRWEEILDHNEKYARGEIYYPKWTDDILIHETDEEKKERLKMPVY